MIAQAGGLTYTFEPAKRQVIPTPETQPNEGTPFDTPTPPAEKMANVEGLTNNYYNAYGRLKDFTTTMWQDYGIDVTKPDLTQEGGGQFHQAYLNMDANLQMTAQDLVQQRKWQEEAMTKQMEGKGTLTAGFNPRQQLFSTADQAGFTSTDLTPDVKSALDFANTVFSEPGDKDNGRSRAAAVAEIDRLRKVYEQKAIDDRYNKQFWQQQVDALRNPVWEPKQFASREKGGDGGTQEQKNFDPFLHEIRTGGKLGQPGAVETKDGWKPVMIIKSDVSVPETYGTKTIKDSEGKDQVVNKQVLFRYIDENGQVFERYQYPLDKPEYDERVDNRTVDQNLDDYYKLHPNATNWEKWKSEQKNRRNRSTLAESDIGLSAQQISELRSNKEENIKTLGKFKKQIADEKSRLENLFAIDKPGTSTHWGVGSRQQDKDIFTFPSAVGNITFLRQAKNTKLYLDDASAELLKQSNITIPKMENLTFQDANNILTNAGYYMTFLQGQQ